MIACRFQSPVVFVWLVLLPALVLAGCRQQTNPSDASSSSDALYGAPTGTASTNIARSIPPGAEGWDTNAFFVLSTELSPATLVHSATSHLTVFGGMTNAGIGAPLHIAWPTREGPRTFKRGEKLDVSVMTEGWVMVWWAGAEGWTNWDCPWVLILQHKPDAMALDDDGLHLDFPRRAGDVVMMPLYGYEKLPLEHFDFRATNQLAGPKVKVKTWEWPTVITRDPLTRIRYWTAATRDFPVHCEESFSVDRAKGTVTVRSKIHRRAIFDDWKSRRVTLAPISPALALAAKEGAFPARFSERWFDLELPAPFGPLLGIEGADEYDTTFSTLRYVNETETISPADPGTNSLATSTRAALRQFAASPDASLRTARGACQFAQALPLLDAPTRSNVLSALRTFLSERLAAPGDATDASLLPAAWAYAHHGGDWEMIRAHWATLKRLFTVPGTMTWSGFGSAGEGAFGEAAAQCLAFARLAYKVGDMDGYDYGCFSFTRELTALAARQRGGEYVRKHQPWHSLQVITPDVFATGYLPDARGWQFSGTNHPLNATSRPHERRWDGFGDFDVARFCRDYLALDLRKEFAIAPPSIPLRAQLMGDQPTDFDAATRLNTMADSAAGRIAACLAILRATQPVEIRRLIPAGIASPQVTGLEREGSVSNAGLLVRTSGSSQGGWPELTWPEWTTPTGARWTFGQIRPARDAKSPHHKRVLINWNSEAHVHPVP